MSWLISLHGLTRSARTGNRELQNEKILPTAGIEPTTPESQIYGCNLSAIKSEIQSTILNLTSRLQVFIVLFIATSNHWQSEKYKRTDALVLWHQQIEHHGGHSQTPANQR